MSTLIFYLSEKLTHKLILTFTGSLYGQRDLKLFVKIVSEVNKRNKLNDISLSLKKFGRYN